MSVVSPGSDSALTSYNSAEHSGNSSADLGGITPVSVVVKMLGSPLVLEYLI